ncbi:unnamed protein product [Chrysoparadoxa australica]
MLLFLVASLALLSCGTASVKAEEGTYLSQVHPVWGDNSTEATVCGYGSACQAGAGEEEHVALKMWAEKNRIRLNVEQPSTVPHYTAVGYAKMKMPEDLYSSVLTWFRSNLDKKQSEGWENDYVYINFWDTDTDIVRAGGKLCKDLLRGLQPILQEWSGIPLMETACYGIRTYHTGAILANHVDRIDTHIISAIVNVDQEVEEPWPLYVKGHDGKAEAIYMSPGEIVLYESASVIHGRPNALQGNYSNIFVHFKPTAPQEEL